MEDESYEDMLNQLEQDALEEKMFECHIGCGGDPDDDKWLEKW
jgi:hypothetical protein